MEHFDIFIKYFKDFNLFNLIFCICAGLVAGGMYGIVAFPTVGMIVGYTAYAAYKNNEYYGFYNLGITKSYLLLRVWILNLIVAFLVGALYLIIF